MILTPVRTTTEIVDALVDVLRALNWRDESAFGVVLRYDSTRLAEAFNDLLVATHPRVALVIWTGERWETDPNLSKRRRRTSLVTLVISDRVLGDRAGAAMWGQEGTNPGVTALKELVLPAVTGRLIANPDPVDMLPGDIGMLSIVDERDSAAAVDRVAVTIDIELAGGYIDHPAYLSPTYGLK